jgi:predicted ester cyclase
LRGFDIIVLTSVGLFCLLQRMVVTIREALAEYHCEIHSMVVEDNKAFCRLRFTGKHVGQLLGYQPTGKVVAWMGATEFTCQNGKILKVWELGDVKSLEDQLKPSRMAVDTGV